MECQTIPYDRLIFIHGKKDSSVEENFFFQKYPYSSKLQITLMPIIFYFSVERFSNANVLLNNTFSEKKYWKWDKWWEKL